MDYFSTLKMEEVHPFEITLNFYEITQGSHATRWRCDNHNTNILTRFCAILEETKTLSLRHF
jgi:hypothetical protein